MFRRKVRREGKEKPAAKAVETSRAEPRNLKPKVVSASAHQKALSVLASSLCDDHVFELLFRVGDDIPAAGW
jgi:hypothetical protein